MESPININPSSKSVDAVIFVALFIVLYLLYKAHKAAKAVGEVVGDVAEVVTDGITLAEVKNPVTKNDVKIKLPLNPIAGIKAIKEMSAEIGKTLAIADKTIQDANLYRMTSQSSFHPNYLARVAGNKPAKIVTAAATEQILKEIWDSVGFLSDDYTKLRKAFERINYKTQVSYIAKKFNEKYKQDLFTFLKNKMDTPTQRVAFAGIITRISKLPVGV